MPVALGLKDASAIYIRYVVLGPEKLGQCVWLERGVSRIHSLCWPNWPPSPTAPVALGLKDASAIHIRYVVLGPKKTESEWMIRTRYIAYTFPLLAKLTPPPVALGLKDASAFHIRYVVLGPEKTGSVGMIKTRCIAYSFPLLAKLTPYFSSPLVLYLLFVLQSKNIFALKFECLI